LQKLADATSLVLHVHLYLIVIDELGYLPFSQPGGQLLLHLISKLYENTSLPITTNLAFADWPQNTLDWTPYLILDYSQDHA
jgi:DNA replication protein DnaC